MRIRSDSKREGVKGRVSRWLGLRLDEPARCALVGGGAARNVDAAESRWWRRQCLLPLSFRRLG